MRTRRGDLARMRAPQTLRRADRRRHTNARSDVDRLRCLARARPAALTSFDARPGDTSACRDRFCAARTSNRMRIGLQYRCTAHRLTPTSTFCHDLAKPDVLSSEGHQQMGGVLGTIVSSPGRFGRRPTVRLDRLTPAARAALEPWLISVPSYVFLLPGRPEQRRWFRRRFGQRGIACKRSGMHARTALSIELMWILNSFGLRGASVHPGSGVCGILTACASPSTYAAAPAACGRGLALGEALTLSVTRGRAACARRQRPRFRREHAVRTCCAPSTPMPAARPFRFVPR